MWILFVFSLILSLYAISKLKGIESRLQKLEKQEYLDTVKNVTPQQELSRSHEIHAVTDAPPPPPEFVPEQPSGFEKLFAWYAHEWPLKTGAFFILLGFVWLVTYAFLNNWVGPVGRITFGIIMGALILASGERRLRIVKSQGVTLVWLGAAVMTISMYAAQFAFKNPMFPSTLALALIFVTVVLTTLISLKHHSLSLSVAGLIIGGLAPILIGSETKSIMGLYSYLLVVCVGTLWVARYSKWSILTFLSFVLVTIYSLEYFGSSRYLLSTLTPTDILTLKFFAVMFISLFFFANLSTIISTKKVTMVEIVTAGAVGLFTLGWINGLVAEEYKSLVTMVAAIFYSLGTYLVFTKTELKHAIYVYTGVALTLLAVGTSFEFDGPTLMIAFSIQALVLSITMMNILGSDNGKISLFYFALPLLLSFDSLVSNDWNNGVFHDAFFALTVFTASVLAAGLYMYYNKKMLDKPTHDIAVAFVVTGGVYALMWIWKVFFSLFMGDFLAPMVTLFIYTIIGLAAYIVGEMQKRTILHKFGLGVLIFVVGRLLLVEVWDMELTGRIVTFFAIGILFIGSVLLRKAKTS